MNTFEKITRAALTAPENKSFNKKAFTFWLECLENKLAILLLNILLEKQIKSDSKETKWKELNT